MTWQPIDTAPDEGLFDALREGIRYTDCFKDAFGNIKRQHGYPSMTMTFIPPPTHWMSRPEGLLLPYQTNALGEKYVP